MIPSIVPCDGCQGHHERGECASGFLESPSLAPWCYVWAQLWVVGGLHSGEDAQGRGDLTLGNLVAAIFLRIVAITNSVQILPLGYYQKPNSNHVSWGTVTWDLHRTLWDSLWHLGWQALSKGGGRRKSVAQWDCDIRIRPSCLQVPLFSDALEAEWSDQQRKEFLSERPRNWEWLAFVSFSEEIIREELTPSSELANGG